MKALLAVLIGFASVAWSAGTSDHYDMRTIGRAEAHETGSNSGAVGDQFFSRAVPTLSEWYRTLGRSEARYDNALIRTDEGVFVRDQTPEGSPEGLQEGCTVSDEKRAEGRAESKDTDSEEIGPDSGIRPKC